MLRSQKEYALERSMGISSCALEIVNLSGFFYTHS